MYLHNVYVICDISIVESPIVSYILFRDIFFIRRKNSNQNTCYNYLVQIQTFPGMYQPNETTQLRAVMIIMESLLQKYICTCHMFKHNDMRMLNTYKLLLFLNCTAKVKQMNQFLQVTSDILF